jgi:hypothetical protein
MNKHFYHGSTKFFTSLKPNSWVFSFREDARLFAVPWGSANLSHGDVISEVKSPPLKDSHLFIYKIQTDGVMPVEGEDGNWVTTDWAKVELVEYYPSWHKLFAVKSNEEIKNITKSFDEVVGF